jgi:serine/threonine-protein kinase
MNLNLLNNRYRVIRELGAGGFGNTYLTEDIQMPSQRCCVVKQLKPVTNNPEVYQLIQDRFAREAAVLEKLGEHNAQIPRLYAYFAENNQFYLVQEWIEGITLTKQVQQSGLLSESSVREIFKSLLSVLDYVHTQGIVHRDIKPDNIILRTSDGQPVLIDFGAVRETVATELNSQGQTTSSIVIGTPGFMPAEQGAGRPVYSSDLYSLGLTAIYLLTGKIPQELGTDPTTGEIVWDRRGVSSTLADVLDRAIRFHPRDRFPSAKAMLEALQTSTTTLPETITFPLPQVETVRLPISPSPVTPNTAPPTPGNNSNAIVLGSLIASGLIGAAVVVGLMFKQSESPTFITATTPTPSVNSSSTLVPTTTPVSPVTSSFTPVVPSTIPSVAPPPTPEVSVVTTLEEPSSSSDELPFFMTRRVTEADLAGKSQFELDLMRNEIYARYGRRFKRQELQAYFDRQPWYTPQYSPDSFPETLLTPIQKRNALFIAKYQKQ